MVGPHYYYPEFSGSRHRAVQTRVNSLASVFPWRGGGPETG